MADIAIELDLGTRPAKQNEKKKMVFRQVFGFTRISLQSCIGMFGKKKKMIAGL